MYLNEIGRHFAVSSFAELETSLKRDERFWNVISIREPHVRKPEFLRHAKNCIEIFCEDSESSDPGVSIRPPRSEDVAAIFEFVDKHPGEPILVHCVAGISRSTAVALAIIVRSLVQMKPGLSDPASLVRVSVGLLLRIRPQARPNALFLRLCLESFFTAEISQKLTQKMVNHPALLGNRTTKTNRTNSRGAFQPGD